MPSANLTQANMQNANLTLAQMQGVTLTRALMNGTNLTQTGMQKASLLEVQMDEYTNLNGTNLSFATLRLINAQRWPIEQEQVNSTFGDGSVDLKDSDISRPAFWPKKELEWYEYSAEYDRWVKEGDAYIPPQDRP